jgi:hypothetical protein
LEIWHKDCSDVKKLNARVTQQGRKIQQEEENIMNTIDDGDTLKTKWNACKAKLYSLTRRGASCELKERETIGHGIIEMRAKYVQRTELSWTGLYGKEPWPRERKVWEKA